MNCAIKAIVLAAGRGKRMGAENSGIPKVLAPACGRPLLGYVLDSLSFVAPSNIIIVVGFKNELVISKFGSAYTYAYQKEQLGTGDAVKCAQEHLEGFTGSVLITAGDMPLLKESTLRALVSEHECSNSDCSVLSARSLDPEGYGRIVRDAAGGFLRIVEHKDCSSDERKISEINTSVYVFSSFRLCSVLDSLNCDNEQKEYYLTDAPGLIKGKGGKVTVHICEDEYETLGVNTPDQLAFVETQLKAVLP